MFVLVAQAASTPTAPVISAAVLSSTSIQVTLVTPSTEPLYGIGSYAIYASTPGGNGPFIQIATGVLAGSFPYTWNGAVAGTTYLMMVTGEDNSPNNKASPNSNTPSVTTTSSGGGSSSIPGHPFTMGYAIGNNQAGDYKNPAWRQAMARFNMNVVTQFPGLESFMSLSFDFIFSDIEARAAALPFPNPQCFNGFYIIEEEMYDPAFPPHLTDLHTGLWNEATAKNWFLYSGGGPFPTGGHVIDASYGTATLNMTDQTPVSSSSWSNGNNYANASVIYYNNFLITGTGAAVNQSTGAFAANTHCRHIYHDNQWNLPRAGTGQYLCTAATQNNGDTTVGRALQRGYAQVISKWRSAQPTLLQGGNCDWIAQVSGPSLFDPSCVGLYDRPFQEILFSTFPFAIGVFFPPSVALGKLAQFEQLLSTNPNAIPIASADGIYPGAAFPASQANWNNVLTSNQPIAGDHSNVVWSGNVWQGARMIVCFLLLRGWGSALYNNINNDIPYMDEYNKGGTAASNWIKTWIDPPQLAPWSGTIYRRRAVEGIVYYNPPDGSTSQVVTATGHKLPNGGFSDSTVNNGAAFTSFTMKAGDGLITLP